MKCLLRADWTWVLRVKVVVFKIGVFELSCILIGVGSGFGDCVLLSLNERNLECLLGLR